ncbi:MAG: hypothetical protein A2633_01755 [Candidatus Sungbacteria bacterium RIFCSPHIGHO2_01_FULL_47_32]|uniref:Cation efflux protein transmembrane domain-containing protein n=1 Tax=Candidatus Sungbacteria bacterium RIFCSPHIGHO2_01_FULL_47_32 TaxID=1802264 RepID=A0A1G2K1X4_9BACT|nr:MAG: hypothetical protein UX72_C0025G0017 [Parcubacteria group bacterium GW2011_GWA2_47_10]OGZ93429.1 MAG: hypothetical protein A2633_01755 [Candidatus Sungbacteria bacterium RIFCSPHIGHO2_01_FULL_47_32]
MGIVAAMYVVKVLFKLGAGLIGSEMLIADGIHNIADTGEVIFIIAALGLARRRPNQKFPLGYMNIESLGSLAIGIVLGVLSLRMFLVSIAGAFTTFNVQWATPVLSLVHYTPSTLELRHLPVLLAVTLGSTIASILTGRFEMRSGKRFGSQLMADDGRETLSDAWVEGLTFVGIIANFLLHSPIPELFVVAFLGWKLFDTSREIIKPALDTLLLRSIEGEHEAGIRAIAENSGVLGVQSLRTMRVGRHMVVVNMKVLVPAETTTAEQHVHKHALVRSLVIYLSGLGYLDAKYEVRYGFPNEPDFEMNP